MSGKRGTAFKGDTSSAIEKAGPSGLAFLFDGIPILTDKVIMSSDNNIKVKIHQTSHAAYELECLDECASKGAIAWFPKSQLVWINKNDVTGIHVVDIPDWLLDKKGW